MQCAVSRSAVGSSCCPISGTTRPRRLDALSRFLHRKFEILLLQVVHPHELDLPAVHAARFQDMETHDEVEVEPEEIRAAYREVARRRVGHVGPRSQHRRISHALVHTEPAYLDAIEAYLGFRGRNTFVHALNHVLSEPSPVRRFDPAAGDCRW